MWGTILALRKATVMRTKILSVTPVNPLGVTAPLVNKGSQDCASSHTVGAGKPRLAQCRPLPPQAAELQKCKPRLSPLSGLPSSVTVPHSGASRLPCIAERFWQTLAENPMRRHATIKMCRDPRHTFIFHVPEGRASYAEGVLHVPQARFICGANAPRTRSVSH